MSRAVAEATLSKRRQTAVSIIAFICVNQCSSVVILTSRQFHHNDNQKRTRGCTPSPSC
jgi:hypothetical protein